MSSAIEHRIEDGIPVLKLHDSLVRTSSSVNEFPEELAKEVRPFKRAILNLKDTNVDGMGVKLLMFACLDAARTGSDVVICNPADDLMKVLKSQKFPSVVPTFTTEKSARDTLAATAHLSGSALREALVSSGQRSFEAQPT